MKYLLILLIGVLSLASSLAATPADALSQRYTLIKSANSATLYWQSSNGRRYVFPNINTFYSWFSSDRFADVVTLDSASISAIPLGGNVTYRPGAKMIKIQTDPRVYAVSRYGVLRWVTSEYVARELYGANWASQVQDVPDAFFVNYTIGAPIYQTSDYHVATEYHGVTNPDDNLSGSTVPFPLAPLPAPLTISGTLTAYLSPSTVTVGQTSTFSAQLTHSSTPVSNIRIVLLDQNNGTLKTCYQSYSCEVSVYGQSGAANRILSAKAFNERGEWIASNNVTLYTNNYSSYHTPGTSLAVGFSRSEARIGESFTINATIQPQSSNPPYYRLTIMDQWGSVLKTCESMRTCNVDVTINDTADAQRSYYAHAVSGEGQTLESGYMTIGVLRSNVRSFSGSIISVTPSLTSGALGQNISVTAVITPYPNDLSNTYLDIWNQTTGELIRRCYNANSCQTNTYLPSSPQNIRYYASLTDTNGTTHLTGYSPYISVGSNFVGAATISTDRTSYASGQTIYITSNVQGYTSLSNNLQMEIYSDRDGLIQTCVGTTSCNTTRQLYTYQGGNMTDRFSVRVRDYLLNQYLPTAYSSTVTVY